MESILVFFLWSYISHSVGNLILIYYFNSKKIIEGVSFYSQIMMVIVSILKIIIYFQSELINSYLFLVELILFIFSFLYLLYALFKIKNNYLVKEENYFDYRILIIVGIILGWYFCPFSDDDGQRYLYDYCVSINIFLETLSMLPQIKLMRNQKYVRKEVSHYIFSLCLSKIFRIFFWILGIRNNSDISDIYILIFVDFLGIVFVIDLVYYYFKNRNLIIIPYN